MNVLNVIQQKEHVSSQDMENKEIFLDKLIFTVEQFNSDEIHKATQKAISLAPPPYDCDKLHKITLRFLMSRELEMMTTLCDMKKISNIQDVQEFQEEIEFVKSVLMMEIPEFSDFVTFLKRGFGKVCMDVLRKNGINLPDMFRALVGTGKKRIKYVFLQLCAVTLKKLYHLLFDNLGNPTTYLKCLLKEGINLSTISMLFHNTGSVSVYKCVALHALWFKIGEKLHRLKTLERNGINLTIICDVLHNSGETFQNLYDLWFDGKGNKTGLLKDIEEKGVSLR